MAVRKRDRIIALFFAALFILSSCALAAVVVIDSLQRKDDTATPTTSEQVTTPEGENMLQGKPLENFTPVNDIPSLQSTDSVAGTGAEAKAGDKVTVDYTGAVAATGVVFQSSKDMGQTISFKLNEVIAGWSQGVPGMKEGGTRRLLIPAELAYGANPPGGSGIPANADLVFDITLHKVGE